MTLKDLTLKQLRRFYNRIQDSIGYGGHFGWDWPTLWAVYPSKAQALKNILAEVKRRTNFPN